MLTFAMRADDGVPIRRTVERPQRARRMDPKLKNYVERFTRFKIGQSFFVEGVSVRDLDFLRKPFTRAGVGFLMRAVPCDEVYRVPGVRVWRLEGEYDEL